MNKHSLVRFVVLSSVLAGGACSVPTAERAAPVQIRGSVTGLAGKGLVLADNGGDDLEVAADGSFAFATRITPDMPYAVTVKTQPKGPSQTCKVDNGNGVAPQSDVTDVVVTCAIDPFAIGGMVTGLAGTGLVLVDNGGDDLQVDADGSFAFATPVASGSNYMVTVKTQPSGPSQTCSITGGVGTVGDGDVGTVTVTCKTNVFTVGGTVSGLAGTGLVLENNGGDDLAITADGAFMFDTPLDSGMHYAVTVHAQPGGPSQTCSVSSGGGTVSGAAVQDVKVTCITRSFTVAGTVTGLSGAGLVLQDNAGDNLAIAASGGFTFATPVDSGATYLVTVATQPSSPSQTCSVTNGSGTIGSGNVTNVQIACTTNTYTIGGTVTGLAGSGLILRDNGGDDLAITANGSFTFATAVASLGTYAVTFASQPTQPTQSCTLANASGTVTAGNVTSVSITCTTRSFTIGGTISGLTGSGLVLQDNNGDNLAVPANATTFTFATSIASGGMYDVTVLTQPTNPSQTCAVSAGMGTVGSANVTGVVISCAANHYTVGGTVNGLVGSGLTLQDNGGDDLHVTAAGTFAFPTTIASGGTYSVTVKTQPSSPTQSCTVAAGTGSGTVGSTNVTTVAINCATSSFTIGGTVTGLSGSGLVLQDNGGDNLPVTASGAFTFPTKISSGQTYAVTVLAQPGSPAQSCQVTGGTGTVGAANVTTVGIACTVNSYAIGGTVSGLAGTGLELYDNGGNALAINTNGPFQFTTKIASGQPYSVTVGTQPSGPTQTCTVGSGTGTVGSADVTNVSVTCTTNTYTIGGAISGLAGSGLQLQNVVNGVPAENLAIGANGTFTFNTPVASGSVYSIVVLVPPSNPSQTCGITGGSGTVGSANIGSVSIACTTNSYTVGGTISGLLGSNLTVKNNGGDTQVIQPGTTSFTFLTKIQSGQPYNVTIAAEPTGPYQNCTIASIASGTVTNANISVAIACPTTAYSIPVTIASPQGVFRKGLVLQNNGGDDLTPTALGTTAFATKVLDQNTYNVTVRQQPPGATCTVVHGSGTLMGGPPNPAISVSCMLANLVFVTSQTYSVATIASQANADALCAARASAAGLDGTYKAWLSTSAASAPSRIPAASRGWYRTDGLPVADTLASMTSGHLLYPISDDENGNLRASQFVFSGTGNDGTLTSTETCSDWTSTSNTQSVSIGNTSGGKDDWSWASNTGCDAQMAIYCFGVSYSTAVTVAPTQGARLAFVTMNGWSPSGGITAADGVCQADAQQHMLTGTYKAFLQTSTASAMSRFDTTKGPWARQDNVLISATAAGMSTGISGWLAQADMLADGSVFHSQEFMWGVNTAGAPSCQDWTSSAATDIGYMQWSPFGISNSNCNYYVNTHLLCLQE